MHVFLRDDTRVQAELGVAELIGQESVCDGVEPDMMP